MFVGSDAVLFELSTSPPPLTVTTFVSELGALPATSTVTVMSGKPALPASASAREQVGKTVQVHPVPLMPVIVIPAGGVSTTSTWPDDGSEPRFVTVTVYEPVPPWVKLPACDFEIARSGSGDGGAKVAWTLRAWSIVTWQV